MNNSPPPSSIFKYLITFITDVIKRYIDACLHYNCHTINVTASYISVAEINYSDKKWSKYHKRPYSEV